jgi:hypothetical protein
VPFIAFAILAAIIAVVYGTPKEKEVGKGCLGIAVLILGLFILVLSVCMLIEAFK